MKSVGCCSGEPLSQAYGLPAQHKARPSGALKGSLIHKLANAVSNKVTHMHKKTPEYQHYRYRQGQQPALASHRRTARTERIPPDGFDIAAPESALHGGIPRPFATRPAFSPAYRGKTTKKYSTLLHFLPFCAILLRQYRTKSVWRLCTPSACKFLVIFHQNAREYIQYSLRFLFHLTKNLTTHLSHNLCAVLP